jgi:Ca-activated chloride channel family protein
MRRIGHLTEVAQENGNNQEVVDEIVSLSKKYGIISQYTSFLVTDPSDTMRPVARPMQMPAPMAMPMSSSRAGGAAGVSGRRFMFKSAHNAPAPPAMSAADGFAAGFGGAFGEREEARDKKQSFLAAKPSEASEMIKNKMSSWNAAPANGKEAVMRAKKLDVFKGMTALSKDNDSDVKTVEGKTFYLRNGF